MIGVLRRHLRQQQFNPDLSGAFVNPFFLARRCLWREIAAASGQLSGRLLDVGCGLQPYRALFPACVYTGLDIDSPRTRALAVADSFYDGHRFPFDDACFDAVLCNQVLEHVFNPAEFLSEIRMSSRGTTRATPASGCGRCSNSMAFACCASAS